MDKDELQGERNSEASRRDRERGERFIDSGKVDEAARGAVPTSDEDADELDRVEEAGRQRTTEDNRLLRDEDDRKTELPR